MSLSLSHPIVQTVLDLLASPDGWSTRTIDEPCIQHRTGWHLLCYPDGCDDGPARVAIFPPDGSHLIYQPPLTGGFLGLFASSADHSDPVVKAFIVVQQHCRAARLASTLSTARQKSYDASLTLGELRGAVARETEALMGLWNRYLEVADLAHIVGNCDITDQIEKIRRLVAEGLK